MKGFELEFISVINDFRDDHGTDGVLEEIFPGMSLGEILLDMYNAGLIPDDKMESFIES